MMEALSSYETSVLIGVTQLNTPGDAILQVSGKISAATWQNLKSSEEGV
jgi:hypothetical protein